MTLIKYLQIVAAQQVYKINLSIFIPISLLPFTAKLFQFFILTEVHFSTFCLDIISIRISPTLVCKYTVINNKTIISWPSNSVFNSQSSHNFLSLVTLFFFLSGPTLIVLLLCHWGMLSLPFAGSSSSPQPLNTGVPRLSLLIPFLFIYT